jgi:hypothetical protein
MLFHHTHTHTNMKSKAVAALPEHAHLFGEFGCYNGGKQFLNRECGKALKPKQEDMAKFETPLDPSFYPLPLTPDQDQVWYDIVKNAIQQPG